MDVSSPRYGRSCRPSLWKFATNLGKSQLIFDGEMRRLRLYTQPIFISHPYYIYKVFDNLYMLWMCIWMCPQHVTAAHVNQACGNLPQIWATLSWYVMVKWGDWGCRPNPYSLTSMLYIYKRCWTTFICCGCPYGCVPTTLRPLMPTKLVEFCHKSGQVSADMWWWNEVIEAVDPTHIHLTSI